MTAATKFMFDTIFEPGKDPIAPPSTDVHSATPSDVDIPDDVEEIEQEEEEEELPGYSEAQLEEAKEEAFAAGKLEGAQEAASTIEKETLLTLQAISQHITELFGRQEQSNSVLLRDGIGIASAIAKKLFPAMNEQNSLGEIDRLVEHTLLRLIEEPRVVIRVNPDLMEMLGERVDGLKAGAGYEGRIVLKEDTSLPYGDCRMEWGDGSAERNVVALWSSIDDIINGNLGINPTEDGGQGAVAVSALPDTVSATPVADTPSSTPAAKAASEPAMEGSCEASPESNDSETAESPDAQPKEIENDGQNPNESAISGEARGESMAPRGDDGIVETIQDQDDPPSDGVDRKQDTPEGPSS